MHACMVDHKVLMYVCRLAVGGIDYKEEMAYMSNRRLHANLFASGAQT